MDQLEFLANAVEDAVEGAYMDLPYGAISQAVFALIYTHKKVGVIPESVCPECADISKRLSAGRTT